MYIIGALTMVTDTGIFTWRRYRHRHGIGILTMLEKLAFFTWRSQKRPDDTLFLMPEDFLPRFEEEKID